MAFRISDHFSLTKKERIKEDKSIVYFYEHKKTKAKILFYQNDNDSAGFATFFKTPEENSKGTTHILEHSVFEGSKKYNKANSLEFALHNSFASFVNAFTFTDKTMYLFCSSFQKDYMNMLDLYLDFVFFPLLEEKTLRKEGHFFKKNENGYEFNGIVFNEMKNSLLGFDHKAFYTAGEFFLPGSYSHLSGGNPLDIVDLKVEELRNYHKDKYHPSNSHTLLYGKIKKNKVFEKLNEVFSQFDYEAKDFKLIATPVAENKKLTVEFQDNDGEENNFVKYYLLKDLNNEERHVGLKLAKMFYLDYDFSPLRRIIEDSKLCKSVTCETIEDYKFPILSIVCRGVGHKDIEALEELIDKNIYKISKNISPEIKELLLKRNEYELKEIEFSQDEAKDIFIEMSHYLNLGLDPLTGLRINKNLKLIQKLLKGKNFEKFLAEKFLPSQTLSVKFTPNKNLINDYNEKIAQKLNLKLKDLDFKELDKQIEEHEKFLNREKEEPNYPDQKKLKSQDLELKVENFDFEVKQGVFKTYLNSNDLVKSNFYFDMAKFDFSKYVYYGIYLELVNLLASKNYSFEEFSKLKKRYFDVFNIHYSTYTNSQTDKKFFLTKLELKYLESDKEEVFKVVNEFIRNIDFSDKERLRFLINELYQNLKYKIENDWYQLPAVFLSLSFINEVDNIQYKINYHPLLEGLKKIVADFDTNFSELQNELATIHNFIFKQNCVINLGISKELKTFENWLISKSQKELNLNLVKFEELENFKLHDFKELKSNKTFFVKSNSDTNFNMLAVKYKDIKLEDKSTIKILSSYMYQYLWDNIRTKNGAYGANFYIDTDFNFSFFKSYSDPRINETFATYTKTKNNFDLNKFKKYSFEKMKLKFLSNYKQVYNNSDIFYLSFKYFMTGKTEKIRKSSLEAKVALNYSGFKKLFQNLKNIQAMVKVVVSTPERIKEFKEPYETIS